MEEETVHSKNVFENHKILQKSLQKSQRMIERRERLNTRATETDSDADDF
jgi:hypothetical protein